MRTGLLHLVEEHADVVLVSRQPVDRVRHQDVDLAPPQSAAYFIDAAAVEVIAARRVADTANHGPPTHRRELQAGPFLCIERGAVALLRVSRHPRVDDRSHLSLLPGLQASQFSTARSVTREKCLVLAVTTTRSLARAIEAIRMSASPIGVPACSSVARSPP